MRLPTRIRAGARAWCRPRNVVPFAIKMLLQIAWRDIGQLTYLRTKRDSPDLKGPEKDDD
jgi:hypothetical protein